MRIDKMLAHMGFGSRSEVRTILAQGRVIIQNETITDPSFQTDENTELYLDGISYRYQKYYYVMLHKPSGVITASKDPRAPTIMDLLPLLYRACGASPVGRLDKDVTGLLLITNDGQLAHKLISPKYGVPKEYLALVEGELTQEDASAFSLGLELSDFTALPAKLTILKASNNDSECLLTIHEGKFHQVKRMFASRGKPVIQLKRLSVGGIVLDESLQPGDWRPLADDEVARLHDVVKVKKPLYLSN